MVNLRPLLCAYHNSKRVSEKKMLNLFIDLFEVGVCEALTNFCTCGSVQDHLTLESAIALITVIHSAADDVVRSTKKRKSGPGESSKLPPTKEAKAVKEGERVVVCCLPSIEKEYVEQVKVAVDKARHDAEKKGKKVMEERSKGKRILLQMTSLVKQEENSSSDDESDSSCQIVGEFGPTDEGGPSAFVDLDPVDSETLMSDDDVRRMNFNLLGMLEQLPPDLIAACPEFH